MRVPETTCAWVSEQARGEVHQPCDQAHLHAERNEQVNVPEFPWTATWLEKYPYSSDGLVEDQREASFW